MPAAPKLRRFSMVPAAADTYYNIFTAIPADRALAISKIVCVNTHSANVNIFVRHSVGLDRIISNLTLTPGESYTESGLVVLAGDTLQGYVTVAAGGAHFTVYGQEVDN